MESAALEFLPAALGAFGGGVLTFASPCVLPLVPIYLGLLAGHVQQNETPRPVVPALGFVLGLGSVFVALGLVASGAARLLATHGQWLSVLGGGLIVLLGLQMLGLLRWSRLEQEHRPFLERLPKVSGFGGGLLFGAAFGVGWTPCVGPLLGAVLTYAAGSGADALEAGALLAAYAGGLGLPLVAVAAVAPRALRVLRRLHPYTPFVTRVTGGVLVAAGLLLATDRLGWLAPPVEGPSTPPATAGATATALACADDGPGCAVDGAALEPGADVDAVVVPLVASGAPVMLEFVGARCPTCARIAHVVEGAERACGAAPGAAVRRIVLEQPGGRALARLHRVNVVPTFLALDADGRETWRHVGAIDGEALADAVGAVHRVECQPPV
jgi:cytochrome c-type biogenesis protein